MAPQRPAPARADRNAGRRGAWRVRLLGLAGIWAAWILSAESQGADPNLAHPTAVVTVTLEGYTISGLATHSASASKPKYGVALFPGYPGILRLRQEDGEPRFELKGNFLVRSRRHWLDTDMMVLVVDAPTDQWFDFSHAFRESSRYGRDVAALVNETARRFGVSEWTFVGTSEGSVSAFHAARMNPQLARRVILTASLFHPNRNGPGLSGVDVNALSMPLLWVHHANDPCWATPYRSAREFSARNKSPLLTVRGGGPGEGDPCRARTAHGFTGVEKATVQAMSAWIRTGAVAQEISP